jgi:hypothetical protein
VLLVELVDLKRVPGKMSTTFPLLRGRYVAEGVTSHWIRFGVGLDQGSHAASGGVVLCADDLERLQQALKDYEVTCLVLSEPLDPLQADALVCQAPSLVLQNASDPAVLAELLGPGVADVEPSYEWDPANNAAAAKHLDVIPLTPQPLMGEDTAGLDAAAWLRRQVASIRRCRPPPYSCPGAVVLDGLDQPELISACIKALCEHELEKHTEMWLALRADQVPTATTVVREHYARSPE